MIHTLPSPSSTSLDILGFSWPKDYVDLPTRLKRIRERLVASKTYLGSDDICSNLTWDRVGRTRSVILTPAAVTSILDATCDDVPSCPHTSNSLPSSSPLSTSRSSLDLTNDESNNNAAEPSLPEAVVLSAVVCINEEEFYMAPEGNYQGPGQFFQSLAKIKLSCSCKAPDAEPFKDDYVTVAKNLHSLINAALTPGFKNKRGFITGTNQLTRFKIRHTLFEVCTSFLRFLRTKINIYYF